MRNDPKEGAYEVVGTVSKPGRATVRKVLRELLANGGDRGALVREATPEREAGVMILMIGDKAIKEIGPITMECNARFFDSSDSGIPDIQFDVDTDLAAIFDMMAARQIRRVLTLADHMACAIYLSQEIAEWLAPRLNAVRCPCIL